MPIDYLSRKTEAEKRVEDILAQRKQGIQDELSATRGRIESGRNQYLGDELSGSLGSIAKGYNVPQAQQADTGRVRRGLEGSLNVRQAEQKRTLNVDRINAIYNQALTMAEDAGYGQKAAEDFAKQYRDAEIDRQNRAWMSDFERTQAWKKSDMAENYANQGIALQEQYTPKDDYEAALTRILVGLPVQIGTAYALNKAYSPKTTPTSVKPPNVAGAGGYNPYDQYYNNSGTAGVGGYGIPRR